MAKQVFVGNGEKAPSLVGGGEREPQPGAPCPGTPALLQAHRTSLGQSLPLRCDCGWGRGAQSHCLRKSDTRAAWAQVLGRGRLGVSTGQTELKGPSFPRDCRTLRPALPFLWASYPPLPWGQLVRL